MIEEARNYFEEANRWETDRVAGIAREARRAWLVAAIATLTTALAGAALLGLTPLKKVVPFVVRVDSSTGVVDVVPGYAGGEELPETVVRHLVSEYVTQRERYVAAIAEADYDQVGAYHSAAMNQEWASLWARSNPASPLNRYADGTRVRAQVQSVTFLRRAHGLPDLIQVRFLSAVQRANGVDEEVSHFVATLQVAFSAPSADVHVRALNPLGFKVLEYRREQEAVEVPHAPAPITGTAGAMS
jgi:type IV secretion system protein VirB8